MTTVTILLPPAGLPGQVATYHEIFGIDRARAGGPRFDLTFARAGGLDALADTDVVVVAAGENEVGTASRAAAWPATSVARPPEERFAYGLDALARTEAAAGGHEVCAEVGAALRAAARRGSRILAVGRAVRTVAAAGLLDGRPAAVCPAEAEDLRERFPRVRAAVGVRFVDDDPIFTAALDSAVADLCLHLVRKDHGAAAAAAIARSLRHPVAGEPRIGPLRVLRRLTDSPSR